MCNTSIIELSTVKKSYIYSEWVVFEISSTWNVWFMPHASVGGIHLMMVDTILVAVSISKFTVYKKNLGHYISNSTLLTS